MLDIPPEIGFTTQRRSGAVKCDFRRYTSPNENFEYGYPHSNGDFRRYTSPNENFEYGYPHSNTFLQFRLN